MEKGDIVLCVCDFEKFVNRYDHKVNYPIPGRYYTIRKIRNLTGVNDIVFLDENGKAQPMVMGCYGIGVTRLLGAAIEQGHDDRGIVWPISMAPFEVVICPVGYDKSESVKAEADALHDALLAAGIDVVLDNRGERPGAMFADWELIGVPYRVVIGERGLKDGQVEFQGRTESTAQNMPLASIKDHVIAAIQAAKQHIG